MPAQKWPPAPVRMAMRRSGRRSISSIASQTPYETARLTALRTCGRLIVMITSPSSCSTSTSLLTTPSPC